MAAMIFCLRCDSHWIDVTAWDGQAARFTCHECQHSVLVEGFTLGRLTDPEIAGMQQARLDRAYPPRTHVQSNCAAFR
jgi:hypothetical protein